VRPFLLDGALVARVDLKADRKAGTLIVQRAHVEPGAPQCTVERLIAELRLMASWLGLSGLVIAPIAAIETLHVEAHPAFVEPAPAQSERAFYGWAPVRIVKTDVLWIAYLEHTAIYHMLKDGTLYQDLGPVRTAW
jgi:hypothetical protein